MGEFVEWFISRCFTERHSTKGIEDGVGWALDTDSDTLIASGMGVPERLGPQLPAIRDWTERHFDFTGYVTGFDPAYLGDRTRLFLRPRRGSPTCA